MTDTKDPRPDLDVGDWLTATVVKESDYAPGGPKLPNGMTMRELAKLTEEMDRDDD